jgi:hypothetical protein
MDLPTAVDPVKATLRTSGWAAEVGADRVPVADDDVEDAVGQPGHLELPGHANRDMVSLMRDSWHDRGFR